MSGEGGFLARWSRRKRAEPEARPVGPAPDPAPRPEAPPSPAPAGEAELSPEELSLLPSPEELTAETDITGFLRQGVPRALRNAALRQAWLLDPAIRDRVGDALDYAWDYNTPGATPGFGPIEPGTDVAGMVQRMFSRSPDAPDPPADIAQAGPAPGEAADSLAPDVEETSDDRADVAALPAPDAAPDPLASGPAPEPAALEPSAEPSDPPARHLQRRRHGGAMPL